MAKCWMAEMQGYSLEWLTNDKIEEDEKLGVIGKGIKTAQAVTKAAVQIGFIVVPFMFTMYSMS
jgi:hypothetical protein